MSEHEALETLKIPSGYVDVHGSKMHYLEAGTGNPILFLHGVPTSSYVWRKIIPHLAPLGRCIAPDLIGFGQSDNPDIAYSIQDHIKYIDGFISALGLKNITIVAHGWGSIIGCHYVVNHEKNCRGLVLYEAFLRSMANDNISLPFEEQLVAIDGLVDTYDVTAPGVQFVDMLLPQISIQPLSVADLNYYRQPFKQPGTGKPIVQYLKELPRGDGKSEVDHIISQYTAKLEKSQLPKLLLYSVPGYITTMATTMWARNHLPNLEMIDIGEELHLGQESFPDVIGESISIWLQGVEQNI